MFLHLPGGERACPDWPGPRLLQEVPLTEKVRGGLRQQGGLEASPRLLSPREPRGVVVLGRPPPVGGLTEGPGETPGSLDVSGDPSDSSKH